MVHVSLSLWPHSTSPLALSSAALLQHSKKRSWLHATSAQDEAGEQAARAGGEGGGRHASKAGANQFFFQIFIPHTTSAQGLGDI